jgi:hypothetical protein
MAFNARFLRSSLSAGKMRAIVFPWRVISTTSPRSTSLNMAENFAFASVAGIVFIVRTSQFDRS